MAAGAVEEVGEGAVIVDRMEEEEEEEGSLFGGFG